MATQGMAASPSEKTNAATEGHTTRGDQGHSMPRERVAPHSEVIGAIVWEGSPCCGAPGTVDHEAGERVDNVGGEAVPLEDRHGGLAYPLTRVL